MAFRGLEALSPLAIWTFQPTGTFFGPKFEIEVSYLGVRSHFLLALALASWACSDGSYDPNASNPPPSSPPTVVAPVEVPVDVGPPPPIVILEKGNLSWPFGVLDRGANTAATISSPTLGEDGAVRFTFGMASEHVEILTHAHFDLTEGHQSILVRAKASAPLGILVTIARLDDSTDYWAQLDAGHPWRVADLALETTFTDFDIPIASLKAQGPGEPQPFGGTGTGVNLFGFLVANAGATDVWFEHIEIK